MKWMKALGAVILRNARAPLDSADRKRRRVRVSIANDVLGVSHSGADMLRMAMLIRSLIVVLALLLALAPAEAERQDLLLLGVGRGAAAGGGGGPANPPSYTQYVGATDETSTTTVTTANFGVSVTSGSLIVVCTRSTAATVSTVTDTLTTTYASHVTGETGDPRLTVWSGVASSGGTNAVTVTWGAASTYKAVVAVEVAPGSGNTWSGTAATRFEDGNSNTGTSATDLVASAITTTQKGYVQMCASQPAFTTYTAGTDFTLIDGDVGPGANYFFGAEYYITTGAMSGYVGHITASAANDFRTIIAAFKTS